MSKKTYNINLDSEIVGDVRNKLKQTKPRKSLSFLIEELLVQYLAGQPFSIPRYTSQEEVISKPSFAEMMGVVKEKKNKK